MSVTPLFDETGNHCLRPVQGPEEGVLLMEKLEEGTLKSCYLGDLLELIDKLEIPLETVINLIGDARVMLGEDV